LASPYEVKFDFTKNFEAKFDDVMDHEKFPEVL
jgi:hypothetical protein